MITWMFSGLGSQYAGMGRSLFDGDERFRAHLIHCEETATLTFGRGFLDSLFGKSSAHDSALVDTGLAKAALFSFQYALARTLLDRGCVPDRVLGYSLGEFVALTIAGALSKERSMAILAHLERVLASEVGAGRGGMTAVLEEHSTMARHPDWFQGCSLAGVNSEKNFVVAGSIAALAACEAVLGEHRIVHQRLAVEYAFHSSAVDTAELCFISDMPARFNSVSMDVALCSDPKLCTEPTMHTLWRAVRAPIDFMARTSSLCGDPDGLFFDLGPSGTLAGALKGKVEPQYLYQIANPFTSRKPDLDSIAALHRSKAAAIAVP